MACISGLWSQWHFNFQGLVALFWYSQLIRYQQGSHCSLLVLLVDMDRISPSGCWVSSHRNGSGRNPLAVSSSLSCLVVSISSQLLGLGPSIDCAPLLGSLDGVAGLGRSEKIVSGLCGQRDSQIKLLVCCDLIPSANSTFLSQDFSVGKGSLRPCRIGVYFFWTLILGRAPDRYTLLVVFVLSSPNIVIDNLLDAWVNSLSRPPSTASLGVGKGQHL